jgi:hypothetical protein
LKKKLKIQPAAHQETFLNASKFQIIKGNRQLNPMKSSHKRQSGMMLTKIGKYLANHPLHKHLLFIILAVLTVWINGYHFGTFDQVVHIPFLKKTINPSLYPNDPFLDLRNYHFSYFWYFFIPLFKAGMLEQSMFLVHILTVYGTFWMFWALSEVLFGDSRTNLLVTLALIFPHMGFPGFQIIEFSLLNRTFALPFILGSIWLYLKERRFLAFFLVGLMLNIHAVYAVYVLCMFLLNETLTFKKSTWWKPFINLGIFILAGLPVLIWRIQTGSGVGLSLRPDLLSLAAHSLLYTVYYPIGPFSFMIGNFLAGIGTIWAFILGYRQAAPSPKHQTMKNFVIAIGILLLVAVVNSYLLPITILLQFQILRVGVFLLYFGMLYLSHFLCSKEKNNELETQWFLVLALSFVILITPLIVILVWLAVKALKKRRTSPGWLVPIVIAFQIVTIIIGLGSGLWSPGFHVSGPRSAWQDIQVWAKDNTPLEAGFITPPHLFGHYTPDWRVFSERSTIVSIAESMELPFHPAYMEEFKSRFNTVVPNAIEAFNGNYMHTLKITEEKFYANKSSDLIRIACQFKLTYLVVESQHPYPFEERYQNGQFILYQMPPCPED